MGMGFPSPETKFPKSESCAVTHCSLPRRASPYSHYHQNTTFRQALSKVSELFLS